MIFDCPLILCVYFMALCVGGLLGVSVTDRDQRLSQSSTDKHSFISSNKSLMFHASWHIFADSSSQAAMYHASYSFAKPLCLRAQLQYYSDLMLKLTPDVAVDFGHGCWPLPEISYVLTSYAKYRFPELLITSSLW